MPVMRRPAPVESDSVLDSTPERWLKDAMRALGADELPDVASIFGIPMMAVEGKLAKALPKRRTPGAVAGSRIPAGSQSSMGAENKIPRFRSEHGTFVKHEGAWWRVGKQPKDALSMTLERLPSGPELAEFTEQGLKPPVLETKIVRADALMPTPKK